MPDWVKRRGEIMKKKIITAVAAISAACMCFAACGADGYMGDSYWKGESAPAYDFNREENNYNYSSVREQGFFNVDKQPSSYFSLDRNTATYSLVRSQIEDGCKVAPDSVRIEEMLNYFDYDFPAPDGKAVSVTASLGDCEWNEKSKLMLVGLKSLEYKVEAVNANYVFLIDVSGSMSGNSRLGLAKKGLNMLLDGLGARDVVSIVTYASGVDTVLDGGECTQSGKESIRQKISNLTAGGATSGGDGLERAYKVAQKHFITGGNNRVIIISDGDFNVGMSSPSALKEFIQEKAKSSVYLSVFGVGMGNMRDDIMETLATNGNGNYAYLDSETEARKAFVDELNGTLYTVAKDAKAGVTFTDRVIKYRLIGYDTKLISEDEFNNEKADTGEIGSNLCVSALYEIQLADGAEGKLADIEVRYKDVTGESEVNDSVKAEVAADTPSSNDLSFASCVAEFGLILRQSQYKGTANISSVLERLDELTAYIASDLYKKEFVTLVGKASESELYN